MKYILCLLFLFVFCGAGYGQDKTALAPKSITRNLTQDRKGNIWMASWEGVFRYDGKSFFNVTKDESSARFFSVLEDKKGIMWLGSIGSGIFRYDGTSFQNFTTRDGLLNNDIGWIYEDKKGHLWFGVFGGASRYDGKSFRNYIINGSTMSEDHTGKTFPDTRPPFEVTSIIEDKAGKFWLSTRGDTFVYDGKTFVPLKHDGKPFTNVRSIIEDRRGNIWLGGNDGLWLYDGHVFTNVSQRFVGYIYEDSKGNIWTSSGGVDGKQDWALSRYNQKSLSGKVIAMPETIKGNEGMIFGILEPRDGRIWFGTLNGVQRYDGVATQTFE